jgi:hypothetical protein
MKGGEFKMANIQEEVKEAVAAQPKPKTKAKPKAAAKPKAQGKTMRPEALAKELDMSGKVLRAWLRKNHARPEEKKNTAWEIPANIVAEARKAFGEKKK